MNVAEPVPPRMPSPPAAKGGALKWILLGCGCLLFLAVAGMAGCIFVVFHTSELVVNEVAEPGKAYLASCPEVVREFGGVTNVRNTFWGSEIHRNDGIHTRGVARIGFTFDTPKGPGEGDVWFEWDSGRWRAVGCAVTVAGKTVKAGHTVEMPPPDERK